LTRPRSILWIGLGALAALLSGAAGCGSGRTIGGAPAEGGPVTLAGDVQPILTANCGFAGCHGGGSPEQGMDLSEGRAYASIVNVASNEVPDRMRVVPGDSANSYLYQKITLDEPAVGSRMPLIGSLSTENIELIRRWIDGGALP
jgi:hypothetical protein